MADELIDDDPAHPLKDLSNSTWISHHRIICKIGRGGMGTILREHKLSGSKPGETSLRESLNERRSNRRSA